VIERERRKQEVRRHWQESCRIALNKVYGTSSDPLPPVPELPPLPPSRTRIAVERELESCRLWLALGGDALRQFKLYHPHALVNLSLLASLLKAASDLGHLATGTDSPQPQISPDIYATAWTTDLKRAYGDHHAQQANPNTTPAIVAPNRGDSRSVAASRAKIR
jgi:hypothetical protein